jgi:hypothetical protein
MESVGADPRSYRSSNGLSAESSRPTPAVVAITFRRPEGISQDLGRGSTGHNDHRAQGDILEDHRHPLVIAVLRHHLGLRA